MSTASETPRRLPLPSGPVLGLFGLLVLFLLLLWRYDALDKFFTADNLRILFHKNSIPAVIALGMLLIIISGGIDLSVGSVVALVTVMMMQVYRLVYLGPVAVLPGWASVPLQSAGLAWSATQSQLLASLFAIPAGVITGGLCGLVNGLVITRLRLSPFVATLGMLSLARGLAIWLAERGRPAIPGERPGWVRVLERTDHPWFFFDPGVWTMFVLAAFVFVLLRFGVFGRYVYAIGSNETTARLCGINVDRNKVWIYGLAGLLTGWAGVMMFAHGSGCDPDGNKGLELEVIAAVVIGGASLSGGMGTVGGALLGVLIWGSLENALGYTVLPPEVKYILIGTFVVFNTALSQWQRKGSE